MLWYCCVLVAYTFSLSNILTITLQNESVEIGLAQAVNITSVAGDKGQDPYQCQTTPDGSNVLSVAFAPSTLVMVCIIVIDTVCVSFVLGRIMRFSQ